LISGIVFGRVCRKDVRVFEEKRDCIVCLEIRADELMRRLISGELTNYSVVRTSPEPLQKKLRTKTATVVIWAETFEAADLALVIRMALIQRAAMLTIVLRVLMNLERPALVMVTPNEKTAERQTADQKLAARRAATMVPVSPQASILQVQVQEIPKSAVEALASVT
jgi:hypothetical protein